MTTTTMSNVTVKRIINCNCLDELQGMRMQLLGQSMPVTRSAMWSLRYRQELIDMRMSDIENGTETAKNYDLMCNQ